MTDMTSSHRAKAEYAWASQSEYAGLLNSAKGRSFKPITNSRNVHSLGQTGARRMDRNFH